MSTIGIFGGTFDPPHVGHLTLSSAAYTQLHLDRLLWMLTPNPPHKLYQNITPIAHRIAMVELALAGFPEFELSRLELDRPGPHYTLDTVRLVKEENPGSGIIYLMGGDSLRDLPSWHHPSELVSALDSIAVMRRPGVDYDLPAIEEIVPGITEKIRFINAPLIDISATELRSLVNADKPFRKFVTPAVYEYIIQHVLYTNESAL